MLSFSRDSASSTIIANTLDRTLLGEMQRKGEKRSSVELNEDAKIILEERIRKERKTLAYSNPVAVFPIFLMHLFVVLPVWLTVLLPTSTNIYYCIYQNLRDCMLTCMFNSELVSFDLRIVQIH